MRAARATPGRPAPIRRGLRRRSFVVATALCLTLAALEVAEEPRYALIAPTATDTVVDAILGGLAALSCGVGLVALRAERRSSAFVSRARARSFHRSASEAARSGGGRSRLSGFQDLEFLGQASPRDRQRVARRWCEYLRTPPAANPPGGARPSEDDELRRALQTMIARHLRPDGADDAFAVYWPEVDTLDLEGAHLLDLDLSGCVVPARSTFHSAVFHGATSFERARFTADASFDAARFVGDASFAGADFAGDAAFYGCTFGGGACFDLTGFRLSGAFFTSTFAGWASFRESRISRNLEFAHAVFSEVADMEGARVGRRYRHSLPPGWVVARRDGGSGLVELRRST